MLLDPVHHDEPWPYFTSSSAFSKAELVHIDALFSSASDWEQHRSALYDGAMSDVTGGIDPTTRTCLIDRMQELTGLPLTAKLKANVQRMAPGEDVRPHSDQPLLGYETARLVLQLNADWRVSDGGLLQVHGDPTGLLTTQRFLPERNHAFGFVMSPGSYHSVTRVRRQRRSVVFYFWHVGNTTALSTYLDEQMADLQFGALPRELDDCRQHADEHLPEAQSFAAATAACLLQRWGYEPAVQQRAHDGIAWPDRDSVHRWWKGARVTPIEDEVAFAILLTRWVVSLQLGCFEPARWRALRAALPSAACPPRLRACHALAFP